MGTLSCCPELAWGPGLGVEEQAQHRAPQPRPPPSKARCTYGPRLLLPWGCWRVLSLGPAADGEVGSPAGLERGLRRALMFLRSPQQSANCGNTVAQARKWKHAARWWAKLLLN